MLATVEWGEYRVGDLFEIEHTLSFNSEKLNAGTEYDYITRTSLNQGILQTTGFVNDDNINSAGNWSLGLLQMDFFYRTKPWYAGQFVRKVTTDLPLTKNTALFFTVMLNNLKHKLLSVLVRDVDNTFREQNISLPTKNGEIDFDFMERFVAELEAQRVAELEAYLSATGLKDYELTAAEQKALDDFENNSGSNWQEFKLIDIFKVKNTQCILSRDVEAKENGTPYLCASADNNAISSYISYNEKYLDKGNCIFIGGKTFVVTYQKNDFYSNDSHNLALYLKDSKNATLITQLFCISCIKCGLGYKYSWGDSISFKKIQNDIIQLPVKKGKIDFEFMAIFISAIQKLVIKDVVKYSDRKIAATKQCCKHSEEL